MLYGKREQTDAGAMASSGAFGADEPMSAMEDRAGAGHWLIPADAVAVAREQWH